MSGRWRFWIDRGGTFTDIVGRRPDGAFVTTKILSEDPDRSEDAAVLGIKRLLGVPDDAPAPVERIDHVRMGTTVATNALLERKGAPTLFMVNRGFADLLRIGRQARPELFSLAVRKPDPVHDRVEEVDIRVDLDGRVLSALDEAAATALFERARAEGLEACAISLLHAWKHPDAEQTLGRLAREAGFPTVTLSHEVDPLIGFVARSATTVLDAYLTPVLRRYVERIDATLGEAGVQFMQSSGGLADARRLRGKDAVLSGPAGGVVGMAKTAEALGLERVIGFDMGGTSTDISVYEGEYERVVEAEIAGAPLRAPMMDIHTVAAGGGSLLRIVHGRLQAGPESAGADPGPACYRRGGPLAVTDANLVLGRIQPDHFPTVFGPQGDAPIDLAAAREGFQRLARELHAETGRAHTPEEAAAGGLKVAVAAMARAIRKVTLEKGRDTDDFALQCFGGAGGQHACMVADALGVRTIIVHPFAGVLSALGIGLADEADIRRASIERNLDADAARDARLKLDALGEAQAAALGPEGLERRRLASLRYAGTDTSFEVEIATPEAMRASFEAQHERRFGFVSRGRALVLESVTSEARRHGTAYDPPLLAACGPAEPLGQVRLWSGDAFHDAPLFARNALPAGAEIEGPALIAESTATTVIDAGWRAVVQPAGELILTRAGAQRREAVDPAAEPDPVLLELFNNLFMASAERMGAVLRDTATSVNIKERLDFSCAVFDADGRLLANAPHMPVHLGAMGESVRAVIRRRSGRLKPGDMIALNDPYDGGSHLPDITVIAPVFDEAGEHIRFFVANRGHHADVGGVTPGSTPPEAQTLEEEGVVLTDLQVARGGALCEDALRAALADAPYPARNPDANIADIRAQIAANLAGVEDLQAMIARYGWPGVSAYAGHVMDNAERSVREMIARLQDGEMSLVMDDGETLRAAVSIDRTARSARIDFTGTGPQRRGNFNAPPAVTRSAVLYVFRCLLSEPLPLNEGCLRPLTIDIPKGSFLAPEPGAAVVAGNTEVSQALCNVLLGALRASAASQGTMNNLLLGNARFQYYETICGGAAAGPDFDGAPAVHTHMTNTRITDPEILELSYPLRVERFEIRRGSGGAGAHPGGDGATRTLRVLEDATVTLVASSRETPPFGCEGGAPGASGRQWIERGDGGVEPLGGVARAELHAGDAVTIETPGAGGWGQPEAGREPD